ncbi:hypothetical protein [Curtobacterium sp. ME26]|uniref:hypothetical protein n=1 Tax=Curtobacterium sp. ME26 TaxID=2744254 RepID=UPI0015F573AC|nr:hypothetical protein [Curtobacterium sp. ME26]
MYAKAIESRDRRPLSMLLAPLSPDASPVSVLHAAGWRRFGEDILKVDGAVLVSSDGEQLEIWSENTRLLHADSEPQGPPSWWDIIVLNEDHVCVAFFPPGAPIGTSGSLNAFRGHPSTAQALLPLMQRLQP